MVQVKNKRAHEAEERRARILEAATEIIGVRGYHAFVLQDLAKRCGLTNGGLLYHFTSKEQLFQVASGTPEVSLLDEPPRLDVARTQTWFAN